MRYNKSIENIIDWLIDKKNLYSWNLQDLSSITGYSVSGVRKALKEKTLKYDAIEKIISEKELVQEFEDFLESKKETKSENYSSEPKTNNQLINYSELPDEVIEYEFVRRFETLKERPIINRVLNSEIEVVVIKRILEITQSKETLKQYLET